MNKKIELSAGEEIIKTTKPHSASFLSSPTFWLGVFLVFLWLPKGLFAGFQLIRFLSGISGLSLIALAYLRRVFAYKFYFTDQRVISNYSFVRKAYREIYYRNLFEVKVIQGIFGKICGYADLWLYGHQGGWVVGRMRGVRLGDCQIVVRKAWKGNSKSKP